MVKLIDLLKEVGEASAKPYDWKMTADHEDYKEYMFQTKSGFYYKVEIEVLEGYEERDSAFVQFGIVEPDEDDMGFTNFDAVPSKGDLFNIMATIVEVLKDLIKKNPNIKYLQFETTKGRGKESNARLNLYAKYIQKHLPNSTMATDSRRGYEMTSIKLKEIGEATAKPYDWDNYMDEDEYKEYGFETDSGLNYKLDIAVSEGDEERDSAVVSFGISELDTWDYFTDYEKVPSKGELYKVMATVVDILKDFIKKNKQVKYMYFTTNKLGKEVGKDQSARLNLYRRYIQTHLPNAKIDTKVIDGEEATMITLKELNVPTPEDAYKFIKSTKTKNRGAGSMYKYTFKNEKGTVLDATCNVIPTEDGGKVMYVAFGIAKEKSDDEDKKYNIKTDSGDVLKVLATVVQAVRKTMEIEGGEDTFEEILFSPSDPKRDRIYNYYIQSLFPKFQEKQQDKGRFRKYVNTGFKK